MFTMQSLLKNQEYNNIRYGYIADLIYRIKKDWVPQDLTRLYFMYQPLIRKLEQHLRPRFSSYAEMKDVVYSEFCLLIFKYRPETGYNVTAYLKQLLGKRVIQAQDASNRGATKGNLTVSNFELENQDNPSDNLMGYLMDQGKLSVRQSYDEEAYDTHFECAQHLRGFLDEFKVEVAILFFCLGFDKIEIARIFGVTQSRIATVIEETRKCLESYLGERKHAALRS